MTPIKMSSVGKIKVAMTIMLSLFQVNYSFNVNDKKDETFVNFKDSFLRSENVNISREVSPNATVIIVFETS